MLIGVDGCAGGWIAVSRARPGGPIACERIGALDELFGRPVTPRLVGVDIPIGLLERGQRACDVQVRRLLGPRRSCVFTPPLRPMLAAASHAEASRVRRAIEGLGMSIQAWWITAKIREMDELLRAHPGRRAVVREVHPELSFFALNGGRPVCSRKKTAAGRAQRVRLLRRWCGRAITDALARRPALGCAADDVVDAFAVLWSVERIARGTALRLPDGAPAVDACGLPMEIVG